MAISDADDDAEDGFIGKAGKMLTINVEIPSKMIKKVNSKYILEIVAYLKIFLHLQPAKKRYFHCPLYEAKKGYFEPKLNTLKVVECYF